MIPDENNNDIKPQILAPAGNKASFLAALAAEADAIYCGLKNFSARMEADNFSMEELARLTTLARNRGVKVYVALNTLVKPGDMESAGKLLDKLTTQVEPDAIIIADLAFVQLAKQVGFKGELHLSTLANMSFTRGLSTAAKIPGITRVVIPREMDIDEIKAMAGACPDGMDLEAFIHGALCYAVSGRCYWSSFFGGKSGLRGRCVQPCRRLYTQDREKKRFFSCQDLSLDVLVKVLADVPKVGVWKIEGRKKGPHYVYYTVSAYRTLRDRGREPAMKKVALSLLEQALGRRSTHYNFLPQRPQNPVDTGSQTGSGLLVGKVQGGGAKPYMVPRQELLSGDLLRVGYEDEPGHRIVRVTKRIPKRGRLVLKASSVRGGSPVFLVDRREKEMEQLIKGLEGELERIPVKSTTPSSATLSFPRGGRRKGQPLEMTVRRRPGRDRNQGVWLSEDAARTVKGGGGWVWLPPVVWPEEEERLMEYIARIIRKGGKNFVLNAPWQLSLFETGGKKRDAKLNLWAGPFCNQANGLSIKTLADMGFSGVIVSPELSREEFLMLPKQSPLPLGVVVSGYWPLAVARTLAEEFNAGETFKSPMGEPGWVKRYGSDYWIYPGWKLDITSKRDELAKAGYAMFVSLEESVPKKVELKSRPGLWNWNLRLL